jgi:hypothetical protein
MAMAPRTRTYILERTRDLFTGRSDEPCSGVAHLVPTDSGAAPLLLADSMAALLSPSYSGAILLTFAIIEVGPWPSPAARETFTSGALLPRIIKD